LSQSGNSAGAGSGRSGGGGGGSSRSGRARSATGGASTTKTTKTGEARKSDSPDRPGASGHRFGPELTCSECGILWDVHQREPKPCKTDVVADVFARRPSGDFDDTPAAKTTEPSSKAALDVPVDSANKE